MPEPGDPEEGGSTPFLWTLEAEAGRQGIGAPPLASGGALPVRSRGMAPEVQAEEQLLQQGPQAAWGCVHPTCGFSGNVTQPPLPRRCLALSQRRQ